MLNPPGRGGFATNAAVPCSTAKSANGSSNASRVLPAKRRKMTVPKTPSTRSGRTKGFATLGQGLPSGAIAIVVPLEGRPLARMLIGVSQPSSTSAGTAKTA